MVDYPKSERKSPKRPKPGQRKKSISEQLPPQLRLKSAPEVRLRKIEGLPEREAGYQGVLNDSGRSLYLGIGRSVECHHIHTEDDYPHARQVWKHTVAGTVQHMAAEDEDSVLVATEEKHHNGDVGISRIERVDARGSHELCHLTSVARALCVTKRYAVVVLARTKKNSARLVAIDRRTGYVMHDEPLPRDRVNLTPGYGDAVVIGDREGGNVRYVNFERRCHEPRRPPQRPPESSALRPEPDCPPLPCGCREHPQPADSTSLPAPGLYVPNEDCRPGSGGVSDRCWLYYMIGSKVVKVNICDPTQPPCEVILQWPIRTLSLSARHLVAQAEDRNHLAVIDPGPMTVEYERGMGRRQMSLAAPRNTNTLFMTDDEDGAVYVLDMEPFLPVDLEPVFGVESNERVYYGHSGAFWEPDGAKLGTWEVLIVPLLEKGQSFNGDIGNWADWLRESDGTLELVSDYYDEVTYDKLTTAFDIFGVDSAGVYNGPPVTMPKKFRDYYYGPWIPGGLEALIGFGGGPGPTPPTFSVTFTGEESLEIRAISALAGRPPRDFTLLFPAVSARVSLTEEFTLTWDPAGQLRFIYLSGQDREGANYLVDARSTSLGEAVSIDINQTDLENGTAQSEIATHLHTMIQAAFQPGGSAEGKAIDFSMPVVRWLDSGQGLGMLDISIHIAPGEGPETPSVSNVSGFGFDEIGFTQNKAIAARFTLPNAEESDLEKYLGRVLDNGQIDHPDFTHIKSPYLGGAHINASQLAVKTNLDMSINDGNGGVASIQVLGHSDLDPLGLGHGYPVAGGDVKYSQRDAIRDVNDFLDDAVTAMVDAILAGGPGTESERVDIANDFFDNYKVLVFAFVDKPPDHLPGAWQTNGPDVEGLRGWARSNDGNDTKQRDKDVKPVKTKKIGMLLGTDQAETLAHELGHSLGFSDLYQAQGYKDSVAYLTNLDLMAGSTGTWPHFTSYHKLIKGWIEADHILILKPPSAGNPVDEEALVVALEHWDPDFEDEVRAAFPAVGGNVPVVPMIIAQLMGDGGQFDTFEVRAPGNQFSQSIDPPRVVIANALDYLDDSRYVDTIDEEPAELSEKFIKPYRRKIHLLDDSLRAANQSFDLAFAPEFPVVGMEATVQAMDNIIVGSQTVPVFHLAIHWEQGDYIDLGFTDNLPAWGTPDIGIDWLGDDQHNWEPGEPLEQGEKVIVPPLGADPEPHHVFVRLWNFGTKSAKDVKVNLHIYDPGGGGDADKSNLFDSITIEEVPPSGKDSPTEIRFDWDVPPGQNEHVCLRAVVADSDVPVNEAGAALASGDSNYSNDWGQQNVFEFEDKANSPPAPVDLLFRIYNDGPFHERVHLIPRGLPDGAKVTIAPPVMTVPGKSTRFFRVKIELEEWLLHARCGKDVEFLLEAWREDDHSVVRWGATKYRIKPREATELSLIGSMSSWVADQIKLHGTITPDVGQGTIRIRVHFDGEEAFWAEVPLEGAGTFQLDLDDADTEATSLRAFARYEGSPDWSSSSSPVLELTKMGIG